MTLAKQDGRCMCGAVRLTVRPAKSELGACHCEMCRRWTGSALITFETVPGEVEATGPVRTFASSDWAERAWCDTCGSHLWYRLTIPGKEFHAVAAGLFDGGAGFPLTGEIFSDCALKGFAFAGDIARLTKAETEAMFASFGEGEPS